MSIRRKLKTLFNAIKYKLLEKEYLTQQGRAKYLYFSNNKFDSLLICFSAFPPNEKPLYNYVNSLSSLQMDRLYISDSWGYRASYYLFEDGEQTPYIVTKKLIDKILQSKEYKHVYTAGTSKGGTAAIYYGLIYNVDAIFSGACQYFIGRYLNIPAHIKVLERMMGGGINEQMVRMLDGVLETCITQHSNSSTIVYLLYSKKENTYNEHIQYLIEKIKTTNIVLYERVCFFDNHNDVGFDFIPFVLNHFQE